MDCNMLLRYIAGAIATAPSCSRLLRVRLRESRLMVSPDLRVGRSSIGLGFPTVSLEYMEGGRRLLLVCEEVCLIAKEREGEDHAWSTTTNKRSHCLVELPAGREGTDHQDTQAYLRVASAAAKSASEMVAAWSSGVDLREPGYEDALLLLMGSESERYRPFWEESIRGDPQVVPLGAVWGCMLAGLRLMEGGRSPASAGACGSIASLCRRASGGRSNAASSAYRWKRFQSALRGVHL